ncbi:hypothetical protein DV738_g2664, partial [Chaetothyriales sp. CBS 135597]
MGRQADLTRLALGRSPFGDLLRDEQGNVIVGKHPQDNVARDYVQEFDNKGRPTNAEAERATRRLIRAQNEVLRVAGVVRRKEEGPQYVTTEGQYLSIEGFDKAAKLKLLDTECDIGASLGHFAEILGQVSQWWVKSWRSRVFVFKSQLDPPILETLAIETRTQGLLPFLYAGLPSTLCAACLNSFRHWTFFASPHFRRMLQTPRTRYENHETALPALARRHLLDMLVFSLEWPLRAFSILQCAHLIPLSPFPSWRSFIPWMAESPLQTPNVIGSIMTGDAMAILTALLTNPFLMAYISDLIRESLSSGFHAVLSNCLPQPTQPDPWSLEIMTRYCSDEEPSYSRDQLIGVRLGIHEPYARDVDNPIFYHFQRQYRGPQTVLPALRAAFPGFFRPLARFIKFDRPIGIEDFLSRVHMHCCRRYLNLARMYRHMPEVDDKQMREEASLQAFYRLGLDIIDLGIDIDKWTSSLTIPAYLTSTPTPETLSVIEGMSEVAGPVQNTNPQGGEDGINNTEEQGAATAQSPTDSLERADEPASEADEPLVGADETADETADERADDRAEERADEMADELEGERAGSHGAPDTRPSPGVVSELLPGMDGYEPPMESLLEPRPDDWRELYFARDPSPPPGRLRPGMPARRQAIETDEATSEIAMDIRSSLQNPNLLKPMGAHTYRVTHLSLTSKEVFSMFTSNIITSVLMLPLDIYVSRLVVRGFALSVPASRGAAILQDLWPASPWAAAREMGTRGNLSFFSRLFWSFGVQGIMTATMSAALGSIARWIGRRGFLWGTRMAKRKSEPRPEMDTTGVARPSKRARVEAAATEPEGASITKHNGVKSNGDLYLDTINRSVLDFDFEKLCSVTLSNINVYACLVCGKYFQGRGLKSHAYFHALDVDHHVYINMETKKVYVLPEGYEVLNKSLDDIKFVVDPKFTPEEVRKLDRVPRESTDLANKPYRPGFIGMNNIKANDYLNVVVQALSHVSPLRNFFLLEGSNGFKPNTAQLPIRFGTLIRKIWNPKAFRSHVSPHELLQEIGLRSSKKFSLTEQADPVEFMSWFLNQLHTCFQGKLRLESQAITAKSDITGDRLRFEESSTISSNVTPYFVLTLDLPPTPLFRDAIEDKNIIPQIPLTTLLQKYSGLVASEKSNHRVRHRLLHPLPPYLLFHIKRFSVNKFVSERNPTIVTFASPRALDMSPFVEPNPALHPPGQPIYYELVANVVLDTINAADAANKAVGGRGERVAWKVQLRDKAVAYAQAHATTTTTNLPEWLEIQDLFVERAEAETLFTRESYLMVWERKKAVVKP